MAARFVTPLRVELLTVDRSSDGRGSWRLLADLVFLSDLLATAVTVPIGFITDFASVPRLPVAYFLVGNTSHQAAVIHDWLYTRHDTTRAVADAVLREAMAAAGAPAWRRWLMWTGARLGGRGAWSAPGQAQLQLAPLALS